MVNPTTAKRDQNLISLYRKTDKYKGFEKKIMLKK